MCERVWLHVWACAELRVCVSAECIAGAFVSMYNGCKLCCHFVGQRSRSACIFQAFPDRPRAGLPGSVVIVGVRH